MDINEFKRKVGLNIKSARVKKDFRQTDLADFTQLARGSIGKIERGQQNLTVETLYTIANILGVSPKSLLDID